MRKSFALGLAAAAVGGLSLAAPASVLVNPTSMTTGSATYTVGNTAVVASVTTANTSQSKTDNNVTDPGYPLYGQTWSEAETAANVTSASPAAVSTQTTTTYNSSATFVPQGSGYPYFTGNCRATSAVAFQVDAPGLYDVGAQFVLPSIIATDGENGSYTLTDNGTVAATGGYNSSAAGLGLPPVTGTLTVAPSTAYPTETAYANDLITTLQPGHAYVLTTTASYNLFQETLYGTASARSSVTAVPEPTAAAAVGVAVLLVTRRRARAFAVGRGRTAEPGEASARIRCPRSS